MTQLFRTILVPHDFSDAADEALGIAAELAAAHRGRIVVLHAIAEYAPVSVFPGAGEVSWVPPENLEADVRAQLESTVRQAIGRRRVRTECRVESGDPFQRIIDAARGVDSIVMGTLGRTGLAHLLIGSVAEKVVRHAPVPVLTIRPDAVSRSARRTTARPPRAAAGPRPRRVSARKSRGA